MLQILQKLLTEFCGKFIVMRHLTGIVFAIVNLTQAIVIKQLRARAAYLGISTLITLLTYTNFCVEPSEASSLLLSTLKRSTSTVSRSGVHTLEGKRIRKSMTVLQVPLGDICYYDRPFVLTVIRIITDNVVNLVLAINS